MLITHIFFGLLAIVVGMLTLKFNYQLVGFTGRVDFIENKLGSGTTYMIFKLLSLLIVLGGIMYATGLGAHVLDFILSPLGHVFKSS